MLYEAYIWKCISITVLLLVVVNNLRICCWWHRDHETRLDFVEFESFQLIELSSRRLERDKPKIYENASNINFKLFLALFEPLLKLFIFRPMDFKISKHCPKIRPWSECKACTQYTQWNWTFVLCFFHASWELRGIFPVLNNPHSLLLVFNTGDFSGVGNAKMSLL